MMGTQTEVEPSLGNRIHRKDDPSRALADLPPSLEIRAHWTVGAEACEQLRELLVDLPRYEGVRVTPDSKRRGFFDLHHDGRTYYFYVYPSRRHVMLLAVWQSELE